ncbi:MAG TPA: hypothetical protein VD997_14305 [Phycisphaerales bacterium]|nr:hypothetical protein [Phycisphaerales bacterium]
MKHRTAIVSTALLLSATSAMAQMVTPPPAEAPAPEKGIPVTPGPQQPIPTVPPGQITINPTRPAQKAQPAPLPNVPYKSIVQKGTDGKVVRLSEPAEYAALKNNPLVMDKERERLGDYFAQRKAAFENIVADNVDLVEKVEGGIFETIPLSTTEEKRANLKKLLDVSQPLKAPAAPKPLAEDLKEKQVLTDEQARFNQKISKEYTDAIIMEQKLDATRGLAMLYKASLDEPMYYHRQMKIEAAGKLDALMPALKLEGDAATRAQAAASKAKGAKTDADKEAAMNELYQALSVDQRKALLKAVIESRQPKKG